MCMCICVYIYHTDCCIFLAHSSILSFTVLFKHCAYTYHWAASAETLCFSFPFFSLNPSPARFNREKRLDHDTVPRDYYYYYSFFLYGKPTIPLSLVGIGRYPSPGLVRMREQSEDFGVLYLSNLGNICFSGSVSYSMVRLNLFGTIVHLVWLLRLCFCIYWHYECYGLFLSTWRINPYLGA